MELVEHFHEVDLVVRLYLVRDYCAKFVVELLDEVRVTFFIDGVGNSLARHVLGFALRLKLPEKLPLLLVEGLLMQLVIRGVLVPRTQHF